MKLSSILPILVAALVPPLFNACVLDTSKNYNDAVNNTRLLFVVTSDYHTGALLSYSLDSLKRGPDSVLVNQDSRVLSFGKAVYVLERYGANNLLKYDPSTHKVVYQKNLVTACNPSDLVPLNDTLGFLTLEDSSKILQVNLNTGVPVKSLDIASYIYNPPSGSGAAANSPHAVRAMLKGDTLYVVLQRRNGNYLFAGGASAVLRVRASTFSVIDTLSAPGKNASNIWIDGDNLYLACSGTVGILDGALYRWKLSTKTVSSLVTEASLGGDFDGATCGPTGACVAVSLSSSNNDAVLKLNLSTGAVGDTLPGADQVAGGSSGGVVVDVNTNLFYVGSRKPTSSGVLIYNAAGAKIKGPVSTGLPPYSMTVAEF